VDGGENVTPAVGPDEGQVVAALERLFLLEGDRVDDVETHPDGFLVKTQYGWYDVRPADWMLGRAPWVRAALRVVEDLAIPGSPARVCGLVYAEAPDPVHLNDVAAMHAFGRRMGDDLDPLAYAEILAEFYSVPEIDRPVVTAWAPGRTSRAGWLVRDVESAAARIPWVDPALLAPPVIDPSGDAVTVEFVSWHKTTGDPVAIDVLHWTVAGGHGREPSWSRKYLAVSVEMP
jgi:hypothetical protein